MGEFVNVYTLCPCIIKRFNVACRTMLNARLLICASAFTLEQQQQKLPSSPMLTLWVGGMGDGVCRLNESHIGIGAAMDEILYAGSLP